MLSIKFTFVALFVKFMLADLDAGIINVVRTNLIPSWDQSEDSSYLYIYDTYIHSGFTVTRCDDADAEAEARGRGRSWLAYNFCR